MVELTITLEGWDELVAVIGKVTALESMRPAMQRSLELLQRDIAVYPPKPVAGDFPGFVSTRQRRWFFAALRDGRIQVPYRRTGTLGRSWTTDVIVTPDALLGVVGTNTVYAPWVQDRERQARIHQGRWQTVSDVVERNADAIMQQFAARLDEVWNEQDASD